MKTEGESRHTCLAAGGSQVPQGLAVLHFVTKNSSHITETSVLPENGH